MMRSNLFAAAMNAQPMRWQSALKSLLLASTIAALSGLAPAHAQEQTQTDPIATCTQTDAQAALSSCSNLISSGSLSQLDLARALTQRGMLNFLLDTRSAIADADRAVAILHELGGHPHELIAALNFHATAQYALNNFDQQIADASEILRLDPSNAQAFMIRGVGYKAKNDGEHAVADFNNVLRLDPNNATAYRNLGLAQQDILQDYQGAMGSYANALRLDPHDAWSHIYIAQLIYYLDRSRFNEAIAHYEQALQINPQISVTGNPAVNIANAYVEKSNALVQAGDNSGALQAANRAIALNPNDANAYNNRGVAYQRSGQYGSAISDYNQALSLDPNQANARSNLAALQQFQQQQAQQQQAQAQQQAAQDQASANALTNLFLGGIAAAAGADANTVANVMTGNYAAAAAPPPAPVQQQPQQPQYQPPTQQYPSAPPQQVQANAGNVHNPANDASACLSLRRSPNNSAILFNSCPYAVEAAWCVVGTECGSSGNMWTISANGFYPVLGGNGGELQVRYAACHGANSMDTVRNAPRDGNIHYSCPDSLQRR